MIEEPPPLLGSWRNLYGLVLGVLVAIVVGLTILTRVYA